MNADEGLTALELELRRNAIEAEREACAKIADAVSMPDTTGIAFASPESAAKRIAEAIRARGKS